MPRQLWLLRHADAEPHGTRKDSERRLTERGERQARLAGAAIGLMGVEFEALLSSPKERALRTATVAAQAWSERSEIGRRRAEVEIYAPLSEGFDARQALVALTQWLPAGEQARGGRVLLVGHEPDLSTVVAELTGARIDLKKGGLAVVRLEGGAAGQGSASRAPLSSDKGGAAGQGSASRAPLSSDKGGAAGQRSASRAPLRSDDGLGGELLALLRPSELALIAASRVAASAPAP